MFKKSTMKAEVHFRDKEEGSSYSARTAPMNEGNLIAYLRETYQRYGSLVIDYVSKEGEIQLATKRSVHVEDEEDRLAEIGDVIKAYIRNRAIPMEAHAVFVDKQLKGVFGKKGHAELKRKNLISRGASADSVTVEPIQVNSFHDFEGGEEVE